jgi:hypothetical protein
MILIAAFMLPSSILALTAAAINSLASLFLRYGARLVGVSLFGPSFSAFVLFVMIDARLCLAPVRAGLRRIFVPKFSRLDQGSKSLVLLVTLRRRLDNSAAQFGLADFGMCLMIPPSTCGWEKLGGAADALVDSDDAKTASTGAMMALSSGAATMTSFGLGTSEGDDGDIDCGLTELEVCVVSGGLSDPGHGL